MLQPRSSHLRSALPTVKPKQEKEWHADVYTSQNKVPGNSWEMTAYASQTGSVVRIRWQDQYRVLSNRTYNLYAWICRFSRV